MIEAAVLVATTGFAMGIGYLWGAKHATQGMIDELDGEGYFE